MSSMLQTLSSRKSMISGTASRVAPGPMQRATTVGAHSRSNMGSSSTNSRPIVRSMSMAQGSVGGHMRDPRPISEKWYINKEAEDLITFLAERNYDKPLTKKTLLSPSKPDFSFILDFIMRQIDPQFEIGQNIEETVPQLFAQLRYPFRITKNQVKWLAVPSTWPHILAALSWLVNLVVYDEKIRENATTDPEQSGNELFFLYIGKAYDEFMSGVDDCDKEMLTTIDTRCDKITEEIDRLREENDVLAKDIAVFEKSFPPLDQLKENHRMMVKDEAKFTVFVKALDEHKLALEEKISVIETKMEHKKEEIEKMNQKELELDEAMRNQKVSLGSVEKLEKEKRSLTSLVKNSNELKTQYEEKTWEADMRRVQTIHELEATAREYNEIAQRLLIVPISAKHSRGLDLELHVTTTALTQAVTSQSISNSSAPDDLDYDGLLNLDVKGTVRPVIAHLKDSIGQKFSKAHVNVMKAEASLRSIQENINNVNESIEPLEQSMAKMDDMLELMKKDASKQALSIVREADELKTELTKIRDSGAKEFVQAKKAAEEAMNELNKVKQQCREEYSRESAELTQMKQIAKEYEARIVNRLRQLETEFSQ